MRPRKNQRRKYKRTKCVVSNAEKRSAWRGSTAIVGLFSVVNIAILQITTVITILRQKPELGTCIIMLVKAQWLKRSWGRNYKCFRYAEK